MARSYQDVKVKFSYVPRFDPEGHKLCVMHGCPNILKGRQERWCSPVCVGNAMATYDWSVCRKRILRRDKFTCVKCSAKYANEVDHIQPLIEGGKLCDPNNLRTLCTACHKVETAALAARRADRRRRERNLMQEKFGAGVTLRNMTIFVVSFIVGYCATLLLVQVVR